MKVLLSNVKQSNCTGIPFVWQICCNPNSNSLHVISWSAKQMLKYQKLYNIEWRWSEFVIYGHHGH